MIEHVKCSTPDFAEQNVEKLLKLFPECAGEKGTVDLDKLRGILTLKVVEGNVERYEFTWPGKRAAKAAASAATTKTLRPCREESVNFDETENLYIEGDNLEVLKLLQTSYAGKVKMIYIDPPYNTGHDFVYRDRFSLTDKELAERGDQVDDDGKWNVEHPEPNDAAAARYHSNWCSMMYPRLKLARNLLRDDGVLFMSIDDNEVVNARKLCDEVFGAANFVACISVENDARTRAYDSLAITHEYLLLFCKTGNYEPNILIDPAKKFQYSDAQGGFDLYELRNRNSDFNAANRPNLYYPFWVNPENKDENDLYEIDLEEHDGWIMFYPQESQGIKTVWRWGRETAKPNLNKVIFGRKALGGWQVVKKYRESVYAIGSVWKDKCYLSDNGTLAFKKLFDNKRVFGFPKPIELVKQCLLLTSGRDDFVLDFFSGSGSSAHAVMQLNAEDGGNRKFIMVQLPEVCAEDSEAAKAGYKNICEIGKERIRRAGKKIVENMSHGDTETRRRGKASGETDLFDTPDLRVSVPPCEKKIPDIGFRVLKLDSSSINDTSATVSETNQSFANFARIKEGRSSEDLLFQMLLETHIPLSDKIEKKVVGGNEVFFVLGNALIACLDEKAKMMTEFFIEIAKLKPGVAFFRDDAFADDSARTNLQQAFDQFSPSTSIKVI